MGWIRTDQHREDLLTAQAEEVARALAESVGEGRPMRDGPATLHTDPARLRGIPAIGRNVTGAIRGTDPEREATRG